MSRALEDLGRQLRQKRGERGLREVAREIGIGHATLSRVENGQFPDLENYEKICRWLGISLVSMRQPLPQPTTQVPVPQVHFRKKPTVSAETARALAQLILAAQAEMITQEESL